MTLAQAPDKLAEAAAVDSVPSELLLGGSWRPALSGKTFAVEDPSTGAELARVADANTEDARAALDAAVKAAHAWAECPPRQRGEILRAAFTAVTAASEELALVMTLEMGKPLAESRAEVAYAADFLRWFSEEAVRIEGRYSRSPDGRSRLLVSKRPVGPCILVTPWNFPLAMGTRKLAPALAAGCSVVIKPAKQTPLSMLSLAAILERCGLPPGVCNVVTTTNASQVVGSLLADPRVRKLSFTGSTEVGRQLMAQASPRLLRLSMELGGNAPFIVFDDADLDAAVEGAVVAKMRNMGEACTAANRFLVQQGVAAEFGQRLAQRLAAMPVGRGTEPDVQVGPLIDAPARTKVESLVDQAKAMGAKVLTGGTSLPGPGYFFAPTVLSEVPASAAMLDQEIFGPVAPLQSFSDQAEALEMANAGDYGLVAYLFTRDLSRALAVVEGLEVGMVGLNQGMVSNAAAPFGGVKQSGFGREGGAEGIEEYLSTQYLAIRP